MNKSKSSQTKLHPVIMLSMGALFLGLGCVFWALINIAVGSVYVADAYNSLPSSPPAIEVKRLSLIGDYADPTETYLSSDTLYPVYPAEGDIIGYLSIPVLEQELPILQGTDTDELEKGVGHFTQSVLPGEEDNCVLSGHRDTVFSKLGELKIGDQLIVQTSAGTFTYEVNGTRIVDKDDKTVIVPADHAVLTLSTCYPFSFIGNAPDRYIVTADLIISK